MYVLNVYSTLTDIDTDTDDGTSIYCYFRECSNVSLSLFRIKCFLDDGIFITLLVVCVMLVTILKKKHTTQGLKQEQKQEQKQKHEGGENKVNKKSQT